jgi:hypothetical protein
VQSPADTPDDNRQVMWRNSNQSLDISALPLSFIHFSAFSSSSSPLSFIQINYARCGPADKSTPRTWKVTFQSGRIIHWPTGLMTAFNHNNNSSNHLLNLTSKVNQVLPHLCRCHP